MRRDQFEAFYGVPAGDRIPPMAPHADDPELALSIAKEMVKRWEQVRKACGAKSDDTVQECLDRIKQHRLFWDSHGGPQ